MAKDYPNRSDLRGGKVPKMAATGQTYGEAGKQMASQSAVPMAPSPTSNAIPQAPPVQPGSLGELNRTTERPDELATLGSMVGPGPGPEALGARPTVPAIGSKQDMVERVRAIADSYPSPVLLMFLAELERS